MQWSDIALISLAIFSLAIIALLIHYITAARDIDLDRHRERDERG